MVRSIALDTNIVIDILNGSKPAIEKYKSYHHLYIPVTVCGELLFGAINSTRKNENLIKFKNFINDCIILNSNSLVAEQYAVIRKQLKDAGKPIPENDIWIAATCMVYDVSLATNDSHFSYINNLKII